MTVATKKVCDDGCYDRGNVDQLRNSLRLAGIPVFKPRIAKGCRLRYLQLG